MIHSDNYDLKPKRKFQSAEAGQLVFSVLCLICAGYLMKQNNCGHYEIFNYVLFFGSLVWVVYLLITLVLHFKDKGTRRLLIAMDWVFIGFHLLMFVWANVLFWHYSNSCSSEWDFWVLTYLVFGYIAYFCVLAVLFMGLIRMLGRKNYERQYPDSKFVRNEASFVEFGRGTGDDMNPPDNISDIYAMYDN